MAPGGIFILEFANKLNLKAVFRYLLRKQDWNPFTLEPVEFVKLNFDFHPKAIRNWLEGLGFKIEKTLTLSYFRVGLLKRIVPTSILVFLDSILQWTGALWQFTPSVFVRAKVIGRDAIPTPGGDILSYFKCPSCGDSLLAGKPDYLECTNCKTKWEVRGGIYDFREPVE